MNISEIAELAGVSRATVSRFFNDGYLSKEKRDKIQKVIDQTGYVPSTSAQSLRTKKSRQIGVVVPKISSETISKIVLGITQQLSKEGYHVLLGNADDETKREEEYLRIFRNNNVDGIIFLATTFPRTLLEEMKRTRQPVVIVGQQLEGYCCVYHDDFNAARDVSRVLLRGLYKKVGMLRAHDFDKAVGIARKKGFEKALEEVGYSLEDVIYEECGFSFEDGKKKMQRMLTMHPDVDAIFCATDTIAAGAAEAITASGRRIPDDVAIAAVGDNILSRVMTPKLTTAHYFYEESGKEAVLMLLQLMDKENCRVTQLMLGYDLKIRGTTRQGAEEC